MDVLSALPSALDLSLEMQAVLRQADDPGWRPAAPGGQALHTAGLLRPKQGTEIRLGNVHQFR